MSAQSNNTLAKILTYSGTLPLIATMLAIVFDIHATLAANIMIAYGAVIVSFIAGIHWAVFVLTPKANKIFLLISSNVLALVAFGSIFLNHTLVALAILLGCFIVLLLIDHRLYQEKIMPEWFYQLRVRASSVVLICFITAIIKIA